MTTRRAVLSFFFYKLQSSFPPIYTLAKATALGTKREERKFLSFFLRYNKPIELRYITSEPTPKDRL